MLMEGDHPRTGRGPNRGTRAGSRSLGPLLTMCEVFRKGTTDEHVDLRQR